MKLQIKKFKVLSHAIYWIYILIALIHEFIYFSKKLLFFQIRDFKSKITRK